MSTGEIKTLTVRLARDQADELELVATIDGKPMSDEIREALVALIDERRRDPEFQARLKRLMHENRAVLARLAEGDS